MDNGSAARLSVRRVLRAVAGGAVDVEQVLVAPGVVVGDVARDLDGVAGAPRLGVEAAQPRHFMDSGAGPIRGCPWGQLGSGAERCCGPG